MIGVWEAGDVLDFNHDNADASLPEDPTCSRNTQSNVDGSPCHTGVASLTRWPREQSHGKEDVGHMAFCKTTRCKGKGCGMGGGVK